MALVPWEPTRELSHLRGDMDRLFSRVFGNHPFSFFSDSTSEWRPSVDMYEKDDNLVVEADLPGMKKEDVNLTATQDSITIEGKMDEEEEKKGDGYYYHERHAGQFRRTMQLPTKVDDKKIKATFKDGILTLTLPTLEKIPHGNKIEIEG